MRATIKDIAAATGFSVTTISLVLNGKGYKISDETKNQILAKARELNYRPNQLAVSLVKRQSKTIGFIVPDISNVYFANMARAIDEACRENGWSVILCNTNDNYDRDREYIDLLADKGADGIVFIMAKDNTREMAAEEIDYLESIHIPSEGAGTELSSEPARGQSGKAAEQDHRIYRPGYFQCIFCQYGACDR